MLCSLSKLPSHIESAILDGWRSVSIQNHYGTCITSQNASHSFYVPSNGELPHESGTSRSLWQPTSRTKMLSGGVRIQTSNWWGGAPRAIKSKGTIIVTKSNRERSIRDWSAPTTTSFTWHESNHLHQFLTCARWTETVREYASVQ